jgi:wyosine [tRNA(Phe)-imidazoG37] synthetase (radical SAM superfamily)
VLVEEVRIGRRRIVPDAVAAVLPPGYTRTYLPASERASGAPELPQWAWTAAGWIDGVGPVAHAVRTDRRRHWDPDLHSTPDLNDRVADFEIDGPLPTQLSRCALEYRCFTAQNVFYARDEGAIPASAGCNARCVGCISEQLEGEGIASHERMKTPATSEDMAALGAHHLSRASETAPGRVMISFGQGCEGEPLTRAHHIARAIRMIRGVTPRGSININTNGSRPKALALLAEAGLDACRVSLNSARSELYEAYYRPVDYGWEQVRESLRVARDAGLYIALNLLTFPGVTDRAGEIEELEALIGEFGVHQVQTRNLALDPEQYLRVARSTAHPSEPLGIPGLIRRLRRTRPGLVIGNFARGLGERPGWSPPRVPETRAAPVPLHLLRVPEEAVR